MDCGGSLLRETDRRIGLLDRLAGCFTAHRNAHSVEHDVYSLVAQRVFAVVNVERYRALPSAEAGRKVGVFRHPGRRLLVAYSPRRARKDAADRQRAVRKLLKQLNRSGQPKSLVPRGAARFVRMKGARRWEID